MTQEVMTKQEEIDKVLILATGKTGLHLDAFKLELSALGVVIKVERELPERLRQFIGVLDAEGEVRNAGFVAAKPLIEDGG